MCADFAFMQGASRVILIDQNWRLDYVKQRIPKVETVDYSALPRGTSVVTKLKELCDGRGPDVALECAAGEYAKGWAHYFEILLGAETDTSELVNEMMEGVHNFGRCGITGVYVGYVSHPPPAIQRLSLSIHAATPAATPAANMGHSATTSTLGLSWSAASA